MKLHLLLPPTLLATIVLVGHIKVRQKEHDQVMKRSHLQNIKLRVTQDVLKEYKSDLNNTWTLLNTMNTEQGALKKRADELKAKVDQQKKDLEACSVIKKTATDELTATETRFMKLKGETETETKTWDEERKALQKKLEAPSPVCNFLKKDAASAKKLCGLEEIPKPQEPKAEAPKPEEPKAEAPKPEEPKAEAPKPEEPKAEAPKPQEPKAEAPKPEEPKAEAPK